MNLQDVNILFSEEQIQTRVAEMAAEISRDYNGQKLLVVGILKGAFIFMSDLIRAMDIDVQVDFMDVSSYGTSTESSGEVRIMKDLEEPIEGRNVLVVEDIIDTGLTINYILEILHKRRPRTLRVCSFLDKPARRKVGVIPDYCGFQIPDHFIVGYGLDYAEEYRALPHVCILKPEIYSK
ncbi:MAG: hypoxanthine phosphoribosyltransferase [Candidatus Saccharibacteria bacterium]